MPTPDALTRAPGAALRSVRRRLRPLHRVAPLELAAAGALIGVALSRAGPGPLVVVAALTPALAVCDVRTLRLPNPLVLPVGTAAAAGLLGALPQGGGPTATAALAALALLCLRVLRALGMGDVKLASALVALLAVEDGTGTMFGPRAVAGLLLPFVSAAGWAVVRSAAGDRAAIPFGPFLLGSFWVVQLSG